MIQKNNEMIKWIMFDFEFRIFEIIFDNYSNFRISFICYDDFFIQFISFWIQNEFCDNVFVWYKFFVWLLFFSFRIRSRRSFFQFSLIRIFSFFFRMNFFSKTLILNKLQKQRNEFFMLTIYSICKSNDQFFRKRWLILRIIYWIFYFLNLTEYILYAIV